MVISGMLCVLCINVIWCCSKWQNARDDSQYLWTNWKVYMYICLCWHSFKSFVGLQKDLCWVPVSLLYLSFCLSNLWHSELQHVVRWMLWNLYASVIINMRVVVFSPCLYVLLLPFLPIYLFRVLFTSLVKSEQEMLQTYPVSHFTMWFCIPGSTFSFWNLRLLWS